MTSFDSGKNMEYIKKYTLDSSIVPGLHLKMKEHDSSFIVECLVGKAGGIGLYNDGTCAVAIVDLEENTHIQCHKHGVMEIIVVVSGEVLQGIGKDGIFANKGEVIITKQGEEHECFCNSAAKIISITIPASKAYPRGK